MQPKPFDVDNPEELAAWKKWMGRFEDPANFADDEPQKMSSHVARAKPIRHQAVDILRTQNGGYRPGEGDIQAEIVRLSAVKYLAMALQPGTTKQENGKTYTLNENHRWALPDDDVELEMQGMLGFVPPPRKQGNQNVLDFSQDAEEEQQVEQDDKESQNKKSYPLQRTPREFTQLNANGKPYEASYSPGDQVIDQGFGFARTGRVVGYSENPELDGHNLLVRYDDNPDLLEYISPGQVTSENDFGRGKEKGSWDETLNGMNQVSFRKHGKFTAVGFNENGHFILKKDSPPATLQPSTSNPDGSLYVFVTYSGYDGNEYVLRPVGSKHGFGRLEGKFSGADPVSKALGVSSLPALKWLQKHGAAKMTGQEAKEKLNSVLDKSIDDMTVAFRNGSFKDRYNSLEEKRTASIRGLGDSRDLISPLAPDLNMTELEHPRAIASARQAVNKLMDSVKDKFSEKSLKLMAAMPAISLYPTQQSLSLFVSNGKNLSVSGAYRHGEGAGVEDPAGYQPLTEGGMAFSFDSPPELTGQACLTHDPGNLKKRIQDNWPSWPDEIVDSYIASSYPLGDQSQEHTWLHEMGHVLDGPYSVFSKSDEWKKISDKEIIGKSASSILIRATPDGPYKLVEQIPLGSVKKGDKTYGSSFPHIDEKYQDKDGFLTIDRLVFDPEMYGKDSPWRVHFVHDEISVPAKVPPVASGLPAKNKYGKKMGLCLQRSPEGAPCPISNYARSKPQEAWAEFSALLAKRPEYTKKKFPKCYRFWQKRGLVK